MWSFKIRFSHSAVSITVFLQKWRRVNCNRMINWLKNCCSVVLIVSSVLSEMTFCVSNTLRLREMKKVRGEKEWKKYWSSSGVFRWTTRFVKYNVSSNLTLLRFFCSVRIQYRSNSVPLFYGVANDWLFLLVAVNTKPGEQLQFFATLYK